MEFKNIVHTKLNKNITNLDGYNLTGTSLVTRLYPFADQKNDYYSDP